MRKLLLGFLISILPTTTYAACNFGDVVGTYQGYATSTKGSADWMTTCVLKVRSNGSLKKGTVCVQVFPGVSFDNSIRISGGKFSVNNSCRVSGFLEIKFGNGVTSRSNIVHATLSRDRVNLVGILANDDASISQFTAIRK